ncbi:MAG: hypothetical protein IJC46_03355 [Clostridia bacterium]|nr:hypothetical protein [Clostridia bacterium]
MSYHCDCCSMDFDTLLIVYESHGCAGWRCEELECCPFCRMPGMYRERPYAGGSY